MSKSTPIGKSNEEVVIEINKGDNTITNTNTNSNIKYKSGKINFKKANWVSKFRSKEKTARASKNIKNLMLDSLDSVSFNMCKYIIIFRPGNRSRTYLTSQKEIL